MRGKLPLKEAVVTVLYGPQRGENNRCKITNLTNIAHLQYWETLKMRSQRTEKKTSDALALMNKLAGRDREMLDLVEQEQANLDIARKIFELRSKAGLSQSELAKRVGTTQSVISRLEDADYDGHSLLMLRRIASALEKRLEIRFVSHHKLQPA
jgi:ribosome-binding protein aMBF1 (putative translation factor)